MDINCIIKLNMSYLLKTIIKKLIKDINLWHNLELAEEFMLCIELENKLNKKITCEKPCKGCLDFDLVNNIFLRFTNDIHLVNKKYKELIKTILIKMNIINIKNEVEISLNIISNPAYLKDKLENNLIAKYEEYYNEINNIITSLAANYYRQKQVELYDIILNNHHLFEKQKINQKIITIDENSKVFYIDQNFISKYVNDHSIQKQIDNIKNKANFKFVFSPYLIEDGIKMNKVFLKAYFENINKLTNGILMSQFNNELCYVFEEIDIIVERVLLLLEPTRAAEALKYNNTLLNYYEYSIFKKDKITSEINNDIQKFFKNLDIRSMINFKSNNKLESALYSHCMIQSYPFTLEDLKNGKIKIENDIDCINKIEQLCNFLDFINYQTDNDEKKIKSSYQDTQHLKHAWKADYFITNDDKLKKRGLFIYSLLEIKTEFCTIEKFKDRMIKFYK